MDPRKLIDSLVLLLRQKWPWVDLPHGPVLARVVKVYGDTGEISDLYSRYCVDVQVLLPSGEDDATWPVIPEVPLPVVWGGSDKGIFCAPDVDAVVRIGWEYGDINRPYVESICGLRGQAPSRPDGGLLIRQGNNEIRIGSDGTITIKGSKVKIGSSSLHPAALGDKVAGAIDALHTLVTSATCSAPLSPLVMIPVNEGKFQSALASIKSTTVEVSE